MLAALRDTGLSKRTDLAGSYTSAG